MLAIAFDLDTDETDRHHPKGVAQAYTDICVTLIRFGFEKRRDNIYFCETEDLANLLIAINALKALPWFPASVRNIHAFRVQQWSDFTPFMKR